MSQVFAQPLRKQSFSAFRQDLTVAGISLQLLGAGGLMLCPSYHAPAQQPPGAPIWSKRAHLWCDNHHKDDALGSSYCRNCHFPHYCQIKAGGKPQLCLSVDFSSLITGAVTPGKHFISEGIKDLIILFFHLKHFRDLLVFQTDTPVLAMNNNTCCH